MRTKKINAPETVIETEPGVVDPVMVEPAQALTATVTDPVQEAMDARDALMRRHEAVTEEIASVTAEIDQIEAERHAVASAEDYDQERYDRLSVQWREQIQRRDDLRVRADALWQRGVEAEQARTIAIAKRNQVAHAAELAQYGADVVENEQQLLSDMRRLAAIAEGRVVGDLSWLSGGSEMLRYYARLGELTARAQSLGVGEPYRFGTDLFNAMLRVGMRDPRSP